MGRNFDFYPDSNYASSLSDYSGGLTCVIGHIVFGPLYGWIYNFVGIMIGSCINFWLARRYGETLAKAFVDDDTYNKYIGYLDKGNISNASSFWALVLPGFPDDFYVWSQDLVI